jgi:hypothetical protein
MVGSSINVGRILAQLAAAAVCVYGGVGRQDVEDITDNVSKVNNMQRHHTLICA